MEKVRMEQMESQLKGLISDRSLKQVEVAARMDISPAQLTRLLKGNRSWRLRHKRLFCMAAGVSMRDLNEVLNGA